MPFRTILTLFTFVAALIVAHPGYAQAQEEEPIIPAAKIRAFFAKGEIESLNKEITALEKQLADIGKSKAKDGESINDEIARKRKETKAIRDKIKELNKKVEKEQENLDAANREQSRNEQRQDDADSDYRKALKTYKAYNETGLKADITKLTKARIFRTQCAPCKDTAGVATRLDRTRLSLEEDIYRLKLIHLRKKMKLQKELRAITKGNRNLGLDAAGGLLGDLLSMEEEYQAERQKIQDKVKATKETLARVLLQLAECEKQCKKVEDRSEIIGSLTGGKTVKIPPLPFKWEGPYTTNCPPCTKLAAKLNELPLMVRERQAKIAGLKADIADMESAIDHIDYDYGEDHGAEKRPYRQTIAEFKRHIKKLENNIRNIKEYFHKVLQMLRDCEKDKCGIKVGCVLPGDDNYIYVPGGISGTGTTGGNTELCGYIEEIDVEYVVSISGTNPLDPQEIERIPDIVNGTETATPETPGVPNEPSTPSTPETPSEPSTPNEPNAPVTSPLIVSATGFVSFSHTVGSSPCPQSAGSINVTSNNGNPLTISGVSVSGTLSTRLDTSVSGSGSANPSITAQFNCSSAQTGNFSGTITGTATDSSTGETGSFSVNASGTVN